MLARTPFRSTFQRPRSWLVATLAAVLALTLSGTLLSAPAYAANRVTPGNFRGLGFDQCEAPSQSAMTAWIRNSPYRAAGIYISGDSRGCTRQANLTPTWVRNQLAAGWHLMPITLGPQAWCTTRDRYLHQVRISPSTTNGYARARAQGRAEAAKSVAVARRLGIVPGSTLFYDLEAFDTGRSASCTGSAQWFVSSWTRQLHSYGYASGYYSSAASGIRMLDDVRVRRGNRMMLPDQIWIADWNGKANTASTYIRSDGWQPHKRAHQYRGGHTERWGGVSINIDTNYVDLRTPNLPGTATPAPPAPKYTGTSTRDAKCTSRSISRKIYRGMSAHVRKSLTVPLQCLLKQRHLYKYAVTGRWNPQTRVALRAFQRRVGQPVQSTVTRSNWVTLLAAGNAGTVLRAGARGPDVTRVQRAMNATGGPHVTVNAVYGVSTQNAVGAYQRRVGMARTEVVGSPTWRSLRAGRR
jgi:peptidoglycan hydrolase-like protein with peptidoglycan-binding domain